MKQRGSRYLGTVLLAGVAGCAHTAQRPKLSGFEEPVRLAAAEQATAVDQGTRRTLASDSIPGPAEPTGPQPVDVYIRRALAENRTVQAAFHNVQSLKE